MKKLSYFLFSLFLSVTFQFEVQANATNVRSSMNSNGDSVVAWQTFDGSDFNLAARFLPSNGSWSPATPLGSPTQSEVNPAVIINNLGHAVVIWSAIDYINGVNRLYYAYYDGSNWSTTSPVSSTTENVSYSGNYQVHLDNTDWVMITWSSYSQDISDYVVRSSWGTLGTTLTGPQTLG